MASVAAHANRDHGADDRAGRRHRATPPRHLRGEAAGVIAGSDVNASLWRISKLELAGIQDAFWTHEAGQFGRFTTQIEADIDGDAVIVEEDGVEVGHVLAIYHPAPVIPDSRPYQGPDVISKLVDQTRAIVQPTRYLNLPPERTGLLFVFRVFDRLAYAFVLNTTEPIVVGDVVRKP